MKSSIKATENNKVIIIGSWMAQVVKGRTGTWNQDPIQEAIPQLGPNYNQVIVVSGPVDSLSVCISESTKERGGLSSITDRLLKLDGIECVSTAAGCSQHPSYIRETFTAEVQRSASGRKIAA